MEFNTTKTSYVLVPTNLRINHIGSVYGPYETKEEAQQAIYDLNFPTPEEVLIRVLYTREPTAYQCSVPGHPEGRVSDDGKNFYCVGCEASFDI